MNKIIEKIKEFFNRLKKDNKKLLAETTIIQNFENKENEFKQSLSTKKEQDIIDLQQKYENGQIVEEELNPLEVLNLIDLYKRQINELNVKIGI